MRLLARIGLERDVPDDAELLLEAVLKLTPDYHAARLDYARALYKRQKYLQSRNEMQALLEVDPGNREYLKQYAAACIGLGDYEPIVGLYQGLLIDTPSALERAECAHVDRSRLEDHGANRRRSRNTTHRSPRGLSLASPGGASPTSRRIDSPTRKLANASRGSRGHSRRSWIDTICVSLWVRATRTRGEYQDSWTYYERGNRLKHTESRYLPEINEINTRLPDRSARVNSLRCVRVGRVSHPGSDLHRRPAALPARR